MREAEFDTRYSFSLSGLGMLDRIIDALKLGERLAEHDRFMRCCMYTEAPPLTAGEEVGQALLHVQGIHRHGETGFEWYLFGQFRNDVVPNMPRQYNARDFPLNPVLCGGYFCGHHDLSLTSHSGSGKLLTLRKPFFSMDFGDQRVLEPT